MDFYPWLVFKYLNFIICSAVYIIDHLLTMLPMAGYALWLPLEIPVASYLQLLAKPAAKNNLEMGENNYL